MWNYQRKDQRCLCDVSKTIYISIYNYYTLVHIDERRDIFETALFETTFKL